MDIPKSIMDKIKTESKLECEKWKIDMGGFWGNTEIHFENGALFCYSLLKPLMEELQQNLDKSKMDYEIQNVIIVRLLERLKIKPGEINKFLTDNKIKNTLNEKYGDIDKLNEEIEKLKKAIVVSELLRIEDAYEAQARSIGELDQRKQMKQEIEKLKLENSNLKIDIVGLESVVRDQEDTIKHLQNAN
jgi:hypothetical protein